MPELEIPEMTMSASCVDSEHNGWGVQTVAYVQEGKGPTIPVDFGDHTDDPGWVLVDWEHVLYEISHDDWNRIHSSKDGDGLYAVYERLCAPLLPPYVELWVPGVPVPQGSKRVVPGGGRGGRLVMMENNDKKLRPWRAMVSDCADALVASRTDLVLPMEGSIAAEFVFRLVRPASIKPHKRPHPCTKPDLSKLVRAAEDSLSGRLFRDDARIVNYRNTRKEYGPAGVLIRLWEI